MESLAVEQRLAAQPGVLDVAFERDSRGAVLKIRALVSDERFRGLLKDFVTETVGPRFAQERLEVSIANQAATPGTRLRLVHVSSATKRDTASAEVSLGLGGRVVSAARSGMSYPYSTLRLAADASAEAIESLSPTLRLRVDDLARVQLAGEEIIATAVSVDGEHGWERLYGLSGVGDGAPEAAAVRAVLDAVNRVVYST